MKNNKKVCIITVNWNNWKDSIVFLDSVLKLDYPSIEIVFIDNNSNDNSIEKVKEWAQRKKLKFNILTYQDMKNFTSLDSEHFLTIIKNSCNCGYTGGINTGLKYVLNKKNVEFIWLLNNDVVVTNNSLNEIITCFRNNKNIGAIGSKIFYYQHPERLQAAGGCRLNPMIGNSYFEVSSNPKLDYILGASLFLSVEICKHVGLFDERYFLYWDDADYSIRIKKSGFKLLYCSKSIIYHKEGGTAGRINKINDYYWVRNGLLFIKKHYPFFLLTTMIAYVFKYTVIRILKKQPCNLTSLFKGIYHFMLGRFGKYK